MKTRAPMAWSRGLFVIVCGAALFWTSSASAAETDMATGTMTVAGKTYKLAHVYARRQPDMNDKTKTVVVVLLTDNAVPKNIVDDRFRLELTDMAREGKIHGVSVTLGLDKKTSGTGWTYAKEFGGAIVNRDDQNTYSPSVFNDTRIEGKLSGTGSFGDQKWEYAATVKAVVATLN